MCAKNVNCVNNVFYKPKTCNKFVSFCRKNVQN